MFLGLIQLMTYWQLPEISPFARHFPLRTLPIWQSFRFLARLNTARWRLQFTFFAIVCIPPSFLGFCKLGRNTAISPIEFTKAFNGPIMSNSESNSSIHTLLDEVATREIRYGSVQLTPGGPEKLIMSKPSWVATPQEGTWFAGWNYNHLWK